MQLPNVGEGAMKKECSSTAGGNASSYYSCGKWY